MIALKQADHFAEAEFKCRIFFQLRLEPVTDNNTGTGIPTTMPGFIASGGIETIGAGGRKQVNIFLDSLLITRDVNSQSFVSIDDENCNSLSLILSRDLSTSVAVEGRYVIFSNEFATEELDFRRQTAYLGFVYNTGS